MRSAGGTLTSLFVSRWLPMALAVPILAAGAALACVRAGLVNATGGVLMATLLTLAGLGTLAGFGVRRLARRDRERRAAEARVRDSEGQLRAIIRSATDAIITADEDHRIRLFNEGAEATFACPAPEAIGMPLEVFIPEPFWTRDSEQQRASGDSGAARGGIVYGRRADGEEFPMEARVSQVTVGGRTLYTAIVRDVTERKRAEAERERLLAAEQAARAEAEAANRSKDEFLAVVSHELRTPLTPVLAWVRMLNSGVMDAAATAKAHEVIERNVKAQAQLIEDLLDVSRIVSGKLHLAVRPLELAPVVEAALDSVRPSAAAKGVQLTALLPSEPLVVLGDPDRLRQVVWNLLSNAIKFTPRAGRVEVALRAVESGVEIAVHDTGMGVSPDFLPHVFDRFRQADTGSTRFHGGLGLGLSVVRHLVEQHGGSVHAESPGENRGATFTVRLPAATTHQLAVAPRHPTAARSSNAGGEPSGLLVGRRILLVDDEPDTLLTLGSVLERSGAEVRRAVSAAEAIDVLETWRADLLVSDIGMPGEDGFALIRKVRALPPDRGGRIPALALTAYARVEDRHRALSAGFQMHVPKPIEPDDLLAAVGSLARTAGAG